MFYVELVIIHLAHYGIILCVYVGDVIICSRRTIKVKALEIERRVALVHAYSR